MPVRTGPRGLEGGNCFYLLLPRVRDLRSPVQVCGEEVECEMQKARGGKGSLGPFNDDLGPNEIFFGDARKPLTVNAWV